MEMNLRYDEPDLKFKELAIEMVTPTRFRSFFGREIDQMRCLLSGRNLRGKVVDIKRIPITIKQLLEYRLNLSNKNDRENLRENGIGTGDVILSDPNESGEITIGLYNDPLVKELVHSIKLGCLIHGGPYSNGSLSITSDQYQEIRKNGLVINKYVANNLRNNPYSELKERERIWDYVAEGDTQLVKDNLNLSGKPSLANKERKWGLYMNGLEPGLRPLYVNSVKKDYAFIKVSYGILDSPQINHWQFLIGVATEPYKLEKKNSRPQVVSLDELIKCSGLEKDFEAEQLVKLQDKLSSEGYQITKINDDKNSF